MTQANARSLLPIITAYSEGRTIQAPKEAPEPLRFAEWQFPLGSCTARLSIVAEGTGEITTLDIDALVEMADLIRRQLVRRHGKCMDQGSGYWDCARLVKCVEQQCDDCPLKIPPAELAKEEKK